MIKTDDRIKVGVAMRVKFLMYRLRAFTKFISNARENTHTQADTHESFLQPIMKDRPKEMRFFLMSQGSVNPKIRILGQKVLLTVVDRQTDRPTDTKVNKDETLSGFQEFLFQPIIKDR